MSDLKLMTTQQVNTLSPEAMIALDLDNLLPSEVGQIVGDVMQVCSERLVSGHTRFQLTEFVLGDKQDQATNWGLAFQALRELNSRQGSILQAKAEFLKNQGELKIALSRKMGLEREAKLRNEASGGEPLEEEVLLQEGRMDITDAKIDQCRTIMVSQVDQAKNAVREMKVFWEYYIKYVPDDYMERYDEYDRREWRARVVIRAYEGRYNYIPNIGTDRTEVLVKAGTFLRLSGYSPDQVQVYVESLWDDVNVSEELVEFMAQYSPGIVGLRAPIHGSDPAQTLISVENLVKEFGQLVLRWDEAKQNRWAKHVNATITKPKGGNTVPLRMDSKKIGEARKR